MNKVNQFLEEKVMPIAGKIASQRHLQALRDGIILTMPLIIIGSFFLIIGNLPIPGYADFMANTFGSAWSQKLQYPVDATFEIMGLVAAFGIAYRLAEKSGWTHYRPVRYLWRRFSWQRRTKFRFCLPAQKRKSWWAAASRCLSWEAKGCLSR